MQISIIIPCLNEAETIRSLLLDLQDLRQAGHEVILSDGGSHDATIDIAKPLVDSIIYSEPGRAKQMNNAASDASGDVLWFLHADTRLNVSCSKHLLQYMQDESCHWGRFNVVLSSNKFIFRIIERMMNLRSCVTGIATGDQGIFVRKSTFDTIGGFKSIPLMEDVDISKRLKKISKPVCIKHPLLTSSRRWEKQGIFTTILLMWTLRLMFFLGTPAKKLSLLYANHR